MLPLRIGRPTRLAACQFLQAITDLIERAVRRLFAPAKSPMPARSAARQLDFVYQTLLTTMVCRGTSGSSALGDNLRKQFLHSASAGRHDARNLLVDVTSGTPTLTPTSARTCGRPAVNWAPRSAS